MKRSEILHNTLTFLTFVQTALVLYHASRYLPILHPRIWSVHCCFIRGSISLQAWHLLPSVFLPLRIAVHETQAEIIWATGLKSCHMDLCHPASIPQRLAKWIFQPWRCRQWDARMAFWHIRATAGVSTRKITMRSFCPHPCLGDSHNNILV